MALKKQELADALEAVLRANFPDQNDIKAEAAAAIKKTADGMAQAIENYVKQVEIKGVVVAVLVEPGATTLTGTQSGSVKPQ